MIDVGHPQLIFFILNILELYMVEFVGILLVLIIVVKLPFGWLKSILFSNKIL